MAYIYPEDRIVDTMVLDPAPFNRTLGRYVGEMSGMLDRDNFRRQAVTDSRLAPIVATTVSQAVYDATGPINRIKSWRGIEADPHLITTGTSTRAIYVEDLGGDITTLDSGIEVVFSAYHRFSAAISHWNRIVYALLVDGIEIASTGPISAAWMRYAPYLCGYTVVGAGSHTVRVSVRLYRDTGTANSFSPWVGTSVFGIYQRELIVEESRR